MILEYTSYRAYLKDVLAERARRNPAYSLRSFAGQLGMVPSMLSNVFQGKKNLSHESAMEVATHLGLKGKKRDYFCLLVQLESAKSPALRESIQNKINVHRPAKKVHDLSVDHFRVIADWHHLPILEMCELPEFEFTPQAIARRLKITALEAELAIGRLERLELIERHPSGAYRKTHNRLLVQSAKPNGALKSYHRAMLEKAKDSVENLGPEQRVLNTQNFILNPRHLERAKELTREFLSRMLELGEASVAAGNGESAQVFHVGVQMFPLTHQPPTHKNEKKEK